MQYTSNVKLKLQNCMPSLGLNRNSRVLACKSHPRCHVFSCWDMSWAKNRPFSWILFLFHQKSSHRCENWDEYPTGTLLLTFQNSASPTWPFFSNYFFKKLMNTDVSKIHYHPWMAESTSHVHWFQSVIYLYANVQYNSRALHNWHQEVLLNFKRIQNFPSLKFHFSKQGRVIEVKIGQIV